MPTDQERAARQAWAVDMLERRMAVVDGLVGDAVDLRGWLAVERQAGSFLRHLATTPAWRRPEALVAAFDDHERRLRAAQATARRELAAADPAAIEEARSRLGIRLAVIGKGGAGKTVISSTLSRLLARRGRKVFAADLDTTPGLAYSLGLPVTDAGLPDEVLEEQPGAPYGWQLASGAAPVEVVERFAAVAPDGVRFLGIGKIGAVDKDTARRSVAAVQQILLGLGAPEWDVVADLEAGPTTPFERYHAFSEEVAVVIGPAWRSAMTARRLLPMVEDRRSFVIANRFGDEPDHPGLAPLIRIPFDPDVAQAERDGLAPLDACPGSPVVASLAHLADLLTAGPPPNAEP